MALAPGSASGLVTASSIGISPTNSGSINTNAINTALGDFGPPITISFDKPETYSFNGPINFSINREITFDLCGVATLSQSNYGDPLIKFKNNDPTGNVWGGKKTVIKDGTLYAGGSGAPCITTDNTDTYDPRFHLLHLHKLRIWTSPTSSGMPGYGIDLIADYSIMPRIDMVECFGGGPLRWLPGRSEPHATSLLVVEQCRSHVATDKRYGPDYWLNGHRNLSFRNNIFEGGWGFASGVDPSSFEGANGLFIDNPGPQLTSLVQNWAENWGTRADNNWYQWVVRNPFLTGAGAHQPRSISVVGGFLYGKVINKSSQDAMVVYAEKSPGLVLDSSGLVDVYERDSFALWQDQGRALSGHQYESPVMLGRREPVPNIIYKYNGGTGDDNSGLSRTSGLVAYPHKHHKYGNCIAIRLSGSKLFTLPSERTTVANKRIFNNLLLASPHHIRQGGEADGLWLRSSLSGDNTVYRIVPDGFAPKLISTSFPSGVSAEIFSVYEWYSKSSGGTYLTPASPWILMYGASASYLTPSEIQAVYGACTSYEWVSGNGPPAGTYDINDVIIPKDGGLRYVCRQDGTSRTISVTGNISNGSSTITNVSAPANLLEGDWISFSGSQKARILSIQSNGDLILDRAATTTATNTAITNAPPVFVRRV